MFEINFNLPKVRGTYRFNADLSKTNWFRVGGKAQILFLPKDLEDLIFFLKNKPQDLPINILGVGSNIIIKDGGVEGVVIKLGGNFAKINLLQDEEKFNLQSKNYFLQSFQPKTPEIKNENFISNNLEYQFIKIGAGCLCFNVALYSKINGFSGLEFLSGIPGSLGGAIAMNAGCYENEIADRLILATAIDFNGNLIELKNQDFGFKYRGNSLSKNLIFVEGVFAVSQSNSDLVGKKIAEFQQKREATQPIRSKTGGSTFKNPMQNLSDDKKANYKKAWQLIDEAGCRGMKIGDAQISEKHCNFMINNGNAKAQDLINLAQLVIEKVKEKTGVVLEIEIKIIGKD